MLFGCQAFSWSRTAVLDPTESLNCASSTLRNGDEKFTYVPKVVSFDFDLWGLVGSFRRAVGLFKKCSIRP